MCRRLQIQRDAFEKNVTSMIVIGGSIDKALQSFGIETHRQPITKDEGNAQEQI